MTHYPLHSPAFVARFSCLGDRCEDTCCKSWSMQVDDATVQTYKTLAPELSEAITQGHDGGYIMRRDPKTDFCVKFDKGLCSIHRDYGADFLGDACYFFPRVTRRLGDETFMTATLSCPETARLALFDADAFLVGEGAVDRLPQQLKDYLPEGMAAGDALVAHEAFIGAALDESFSASHNMARILSVAHSLAAFSMDRWGMAVPFYLRGASDLLPEAEASEADPFNLLHALMGLIVASGQQHRPRLQETINDIADALQVTLDWERLLIQPSPESMAAYREVQFRWNLHYDRHFQPLLRRWLAAQLSIALFPFAGFGADVKERALLMGVRFATVRLALMCACRTAGELVDEQDQVRIVQSIARVLDHLADPALSLKIYEEPGWLRLARLRALIGDLPV